MIIVVVLRKHYRKVIKAKEYDIVHHIRIQDQLAKELEYVNVERKVMEKMLNDKFEAVVWVHGTRTTAHGTRRTKHDKQKNNS